MAQKHPFAITVKENHWQSHTPIDYACILYYEISATKKCMVKQLIPLPHNELIFGTNISE
jgi:hypothetical protein